MAAQLDFFNAARVNGVAKGVYDPRLQPQPLIWDKRIPSQWAYDDQIMGRFIGFPLIADIIADDSAAVTYQFGKFQFESTKIPKLKVGVALNERMLSQLDAINRGGLAPNDMGIFQSYENRMVSAVRYGVDVRREVLLIAMLFDGISYDRLGIKISNTFGMYSDLKVTAGTTWDQTTAKPITDIQTVRRLARMRYGINYNRLTISSQTLLYISATTEFQNQAKAFVTPFLFGGPAPASPTQADGYLAALLGRVLSGVPGGETGGLGPLSIEMDDRRYWAQDNNGVTTSQPFWPIAGAVLTDSTQDGNADTWDFANGNLTEGVVSSLAPGQGPHVPVGPGPTVWPALDNLQHNPPGINYWCAQKGFPRKHMLAANAVITAGTYTDTISTALPF